MFEDNYRHKGLRRGLVRKIQEKGISDERVLEAVKNVPRHVFFENAFLEHAYQDKAFPIGEGQTISQPFTVAFQTQLLDVHPGQKVLEIGTGSGYQCCILAEMGAEVYTIEYIKSLKEKAVYILAELGYKAHFFHGDGSEGLPKYAPFDRIIVTAGAPEVPQSLIDQLKYPGKLVIPVGPTKNQKMVLVHKDEQGNISREELHRFSFVPLMGKKGWK